MNSDLGQYLREGIERATTAERLQPSLAERARQRHRRRALTVRTAAATGTVAVAAAVFAATIGAGGTPAGGGLPVQTTAYVVSHTEGALAAAGRGNFIERMALTPPSGEPWLELIALAPSRGKKGALRLSSQKIVRTTSWSYRGRTRTQGFATGGRLAVDVGPSTATPPRGDQPDPRIIAVDPAARKWFRVPGVPDTFQPTPPGCTKIGFDLLAAGGGVDGAAQFSALIRKALSCHLFRAAGHQRVDGTDTIRLAATADLVRQLRENDSTAGPDAALWVDTKSFLPVRMVLGPRDGSADFDWLKPTGTSLATLRVPVPAGLQEVQLPADARAAWAVGTNRTR